MKYAPHASYIGKKFGHLTILGLCPELKRPPQYREYCKVLCDCGRIKNVILSCVLRGGTTSCGCLQKEIASKKSFKHGDSKSRPRLYRIWENLNSRCNYSNNTYYKNYGGRGIKVCSEWRNYENFRSWALSHGYEGYLTIDRIDVNGNYCPENCRWTTAKEQSRNKTTNHLLTLGGKTQCIVSWCEELRLNPNTLHKRLKLGWSVEKALLTPVKTNKTKGEKNG